MISISVTCQRFIFLDWLNFAPNNDSEGLKAQASANRRRYRHYPQLICADQSYRIRDNRALCQQQSIRLSGPRLGRPKTNPALAAEEMKQFLDDQSQCNVVDGKIGQGRRRYGLVLIREKIAITQGLSIALNVLVIDFVKYLDPLLVTFPAGYSFS